MTEQNTGQATIIPLRLRQLYANEVRAWLAAGYRCVRFESCVSFLVGSLRRQSAVYLTASWQDRYLRGLGYSLLSLVCGWWAVPWGPVWTVRAVWTNFTGGVDVTDDVRAEIDSSSAAAESPVVPTGGNPAARSP